MLEFADQLIAEQNAVVNWVSFQEDYDAPAINQVQEAGHSVWTWDPETMSFEDAYQIVADASCVVTARMHGTYVAGMLNVPCVSIGVHPKLEYAARYFSSSSTVPSIPTVSQLRDEVSAVSQSTSEKKFDSRIVNDSLSKMLKQIELWIASA